MEVIIYVGVCGFLIITVMMLAFCGEGSALDIGLVVSVVLVGVIAFPKFCPNFVESIEQTQPQATEDAPATEGSQEKAQAAAVTKTRPTSWIPLFPYVSENVEETVELESVELSLDDHIANLGYYTITDKSGQKTTYPSNQDGFEVVDSQGGMQRLERLTVVQDGIFGLQHTRQITRLYVNQPQGE